MVNKVVYGLAVAIGLAACSQSPESPKKPESTVASELSPSAVPDKKTAAITVSGAYMYALAPGQAHGAVYLKLANTSGEERQVVDISTPIAGTAMVHRTYYEDGVMRMRHMHHVKLAPQQALVFEPNGYHIMLMDMESVPAAGGSFPVTVSLDQNQTITFDVAVKNRT